MCWTFIARTFTAPHLSTFSIVSRKKKTEAETFRRIVFGDRNKSIKQSIVINETKRVGARARDPEIRGPNSECARTKAAKINVQRLRIRRRAQRNRSVQRQLDKRRVQTTSRTFLPKQLSVSVFGVVRETMNDVAVKSWTKDGWGARVQSVRETEEITWVYRQADRKQLNVGTVLGIIRISIEWRAWSSLY